jgi:hypothetical protein
MQRWVIVAALAAVLAVVGPAIGPGGRTSAMQATDTAVSSRSSPVFVECASTSGQVCEPAYTVAVPTGTRLSIEFTMAATHCSDVSVTFTLDGIVKHTSAFLGASQSTGVIDFGTVFDGTHELRVQATGRSGGCNSGRLGSWAGTLVVMTDAAAPAN